MTMAIVSNRSRRLAALAAAALGIGATTQPAAASQPIPAPIPLSNTEDMAAPDGSRWVLASTMASPDVKSGLYAIARSSRRVVRLYPAQLPPAGERSAQQHLAGQPGQCSGEPGAAAYSGHGVAYKPLNANSGMLYVVNHGRGETIEIFAVSGLAAMRAAPRVRWHGCIALPERTNGNAVAVTDDGRVYATLSPVKDGAPLPGGIGYWTAQDGWKMLEAKVQIPTGLVAAPDGKTLYVSNFAGRKIHEIRIDTPGTLREVAVPFGPDNLSWASDGALLAGGLDGEPREIMQFCKTTSDPRCAFPGHVARIDPRSFALTCTLLLGPTVTTTATQVGRELWFGSSRSARIWRAPASVLASCPQRIDVGAEALRRALVPPQGS